MHVRRATHENVHFGGAGFFKIVHTSFAGGAANDGIVHHDHAFAFNEVGDQVQFNPYIEVTDKLGRLEETATNVVVAHESHFVGDARFERVTQCRAITAVGDGNHEIGLDGEFASELA